MRTLRDFRFQLIISFSFITFFVFKFRSIKRFIPEINFLDILAYSAQDFIVFAALAFILYQFLEKIQWLVIALFFMTVLNILYISKMGYPITLGLLAQAGDFLFIQTSIQSPSIYRNLGILFGVSGSMGGLFFILSRISKLPKSLVLALSLFNSVFLGLSLIMLVMKLGLMNGRYYKNIFISLASPPESINKILKSDYFSTSKSKRWERIDNSKDLIKNKLNIVLVVMETLSFELDIKINGKLVFPNLLKIAEESTRYNQHHTSWPFSSKSLYSLICGVYPSPTSIIEMRINKKDLCKSWMGELINKHKYHGLVSYSGNLNYDNMRGFFSSLGDLDLVDRNQLELLPDFAANELSVDDLSMLENFKDFDKRPFIASFITMNSHFPYWTPREEFKKFKDPYWDSMHYQDHFVGELIKLLEEKGLSENTILVFTGDHGSRIGQGSDEILPSTMFKVPLLIKIPGKSKRVVSKVTNHADLGSSLYKEITEMPFGLKKMNLDSRKKSFVFFETSETVFSLISDDENLALKKNGLIYTSIGSWPKITDPSCDQKACPEKFNEFFENLENLKEIYGL